ncbi:MAG: hypothetical protein BGO96_08470 [Micrococcales bacterium 73-15]|nr:MAG: hypothetical protein BGO96_08470 [Micrococcales bacterium 73-15]
MVMLAGALAGCSPHEPAEASSASPDESVGGSPLAGYYSVVAGQRGTIAEREEADVQEAIAACMKEQGFEYHLDSDAVDDMSLDPADQLALAERRGYGIVGDYSTLDMTLAEELTPQDLYLSTLSEEAQAEYFKALSGDMWEEIADAVAEDRDYDYDWRRAGCEGAAEHEALATASSGHEASVPPEHQEVLALMARLPDHIVETTEWREGLARWSSCMSDLGYSFETPNDAFDSIQDGLVEVLEDVTPREWVTIDAENVISYDEGGSSLPDRAVYEALQTRERETATADVSCQQEVGLADASTRGLWELESQFLTEHREELDAFLAWAQSEGLA